MDFGGCNQLPADIGTSSSLLWFKDLTRHYTGPGRQLSSVTTVAAWCSQVAYLDLFSFICLWKFFSIPLTQISNFLCLQTSAVVEYIAWGWATGQSVPVEISCSCDHFSVQSENIFPSDTTQDGQIMRSLLCQPQSIDCLWLRDRQRDQRFSLKCEYGILLPLFDSTSNQQHSLGKENKLAVK